MSIKEIWKKIDPRFIRFLFVGAVNTAFGVGIYCLLIYIGVRYQIAVLTSTVLGVLFNFKTIGTFVFRNKSNRLIWKFILSYVISYFFNVGIIKLQFNLGITNEYIAGIAATPFVALLSFFIQRKFVFNTTKRATDDEKDQHSDAML